MRDIRPHRWAAIPPAAEPVIPRPSAGAATRIGVRELAAAAESSRRALQAAGSMS